MSQYISRTEEETKDYLFKYKYLYKIIIIVAVIFLMRLWYLQIFKGRELRQFSENNRIKQEKLPAPRGMILDREGKTLVDNKPGFIVTITPQYASTLKETAKTLSSIIDKSPEKIIKIVEESRKKNGSFRPIKIAENLTRDQVSRIERMKINHSGLTVKLEIQRSYLYSEIGAQLLGYIAEISRQELPKLNKNKKKSERFEQGDLIGKAGIEQYYDDILRGKDGQFLVQVNAHGREIPNLQENLFSGITQKQDPIPGNSLQLTIDADLQVATHKAFNETQRIGAVVALDPTSGEILAWINSPSYNSNDFSTGLTKKLWNKLINDPFKPLINKVIQDHSPPGSTFKAIVALAALQEKVITKRTKYYCSGVMPLGRRRYHCNARWGHGNITVLEALERSCNVFFYKLGIELGIDKIAQYARALGFGKKTNIAMNYEVPGLMPDSKWKKLAKGEDWQPGENLSSAIGQGFLLTTPLQLAVIFSGIANRGPYYKPFLVKKILDPMGNVLSLKTSKLIADPSKKKNTDVFISKKSYRAVKDGLWLVNNGKEGTARWYKISGVELSGKSGTGQHFSLSADQLFGACKNRPIRKRHDGWFVGFAPPKNPKIVVVTLAEHACSGSSGGAPVVRDVIRAYLQKHFPKLIKKKVKMALYFKSRDT